MIEGLELWRVVLLVLILGGLGFAWWKLNAGKIDFAKAFDPKFRKIQVLETRWLGARSMIYLIEVEQRKYLLSTTGQHSSWQPLEPAEMKKNIDADGAGKGKIKESIQS